MVFSLTITTIFLKGSEGKYHAIARKTRGLIIRIIVNIVNTINGHEALEDPHIYKNKNAPLSLSKLKTMLIVIFDIEGVRFVEERLLNSAPA